jgi:hypothetical protein
MLLKMNHMGPKGIAIGGRKGAPRVVQNDFLKGFEACLYREK